MTACALRSRRARRRFAKSFCWWRGWRGPRGHRGNEFALSGTACRPRNELARGGKKSSENDRKAPKTYRSKLDEIGRNDTKSETLSKQALKVSENDRKFGQRFSRRANRRREREGVSRGFSRGRETSGEGAKWFRANISRLVDFGTSRLRRAYAGQAGPKELELVGSWGVRNQR